MEHWRWCLRGFHLGFPNNWMVEKTCNLSKGKAMAINRIFITVMFSYCSGGGALSSAEWDISVPHPPTSMSVLGSQVLSLRWYGSAGMSMCAGTWFSSMPRPQSTAVSFVIVDFRRCHGFAVGWEWGGAAPEGLIFPTAALYWIIPHSLFQLSRGGVKQLTCDMSLQPPSSGRESCWPSAIKVFILLLLPRAIWAEGRKQYCLNTSCFFWARDLWFQLRTLTLFFNTSERKKNRFHFIVLCWIVCHTIKPGEHF